MKAEHNKLLDLLEGIDDEAETINLEDVDDEVENLEENEDFIEIDKDGMKNGIVFKDHDTGVKSAENWCAKAFCPFTKKKVQKIVRFGINMPI